MTIDTAYPLSPLQQGVLFHALADPASDYYYQQFTCDLVGALDAASFERAWHHVASRHPVLRSAFVWKRVREPVQAVLDDVLVPFEHIDWRDLSADEQRRREETLLQGDRGRGFELARAPLMACRLIRLADDRHRFVWNYHHLILDGWSAAVVRAEVLASYRAFTAGREPELPAARPYRDYIVWLCSRAAADAERFWRDYLHAVDVRASLTPDTWDDTSPAPAPGCDERRIVVPARVSQRLRACARSCRVTLSTVCAAAWGRLLAARSGSSDVVFGLTVAGRPPWEDVDRMVGVFINTVPVRSRICAASWTEWLPELQRTLTRMQEHEHTPLADIQRWCGVPGGDALFDTNVVIANYPRDGAVVADGLSAAAGSCYERSNYPATLMISPQDELTVTLNYERALFGQDTIDELLAGYCSILERIATDPEASVAATGVLSDERHAMVRRHGEGPRNPVAADTSSVVAAVMAQAARRGEAVAIEAPRTSTSYRELARGIAQWARHLVRAGVTAGDRVAMCVERDVAMVAATLAVFQVGGIAVPLDPLNPPDRLARIIEDAGARLIIAAPGLRERLAAVAAPLTWCDLNHDAPAATELLPRPMPTAGYLIYTSGSSGAPKGVLVSERSLAGVLAGSRDYFGFGETDSLPCVSSFGFDICLWELLLPLMSGGRAIIVERTDVIDVRSLAMRLSEATAFHAVPTLMHALVEYLIAQGTTMPLAHVFVGGDAVPPRLLSRMHAVFPAARVRVLYGPTEATIICASFESHAGEIPSTPVIGRPLANVSVEVCDPGGAPVPPGWKGELWVGGASMAQGYFGRPDLTAERFQRRDGQWRYRTGDLVRLDRQGTLEFVGRADRQMKIRGYRIEPGEVEALLLAQSGVEMAAVVLHDAPAEDTRLVAYVAGQSLPEPVALRDALRARLPPQMIPAQIVPLAQLPLLPNGKLDRSALPAPSPQTTIARTPPSGDAERKLAAMVADLLQVPAIGVDENFFDLGLHSMQMLTLHNRILGAFGVEVPIVELFEHTTVRLLAERLQQPDKPRTPVAAAARDRRGLSALRTRRAARPANVVS